MRLVFIPSLFFILALNAGAVSNEPTAPPLITVEVANPQVPPTLWKLTLTVTGDGNFDAEPDTVSKPGAGVIILGEIHQRVQLSQGFTAHAFEVARQHRLFNFPCESHYKVAFQGTKTFRYMGSDGAGSCEFNFAKEKSIQELATSFMAIENTLLYGARLEKLLQHDRLGLDQEMQSLAEAAHGGSAIEMGVIRPTLARIADDEQVLERARRRARLLLAQAR